MTKGKLVFHRHGQKLAGLWKLVRISKPDDKQDQWMLFKKRDAWARPLIEYDVSTALPDSVTEKPLGLVVDREPRSANGAIHAVASQVEPDLSEAKKAALPAKLRPKLATLPSQPPVGAGWISET
jgi:bifunctional non-homologous end joining protein LigD